MGLYGVLIVTNSPTITPASTTTTTPSLVAGSAFPARALNGTQVPAVQYDSDAAFLISEIDAAQNAAVDAVAINTAVTAQAGWETVKWTPACGAAQTCYPPAVNYAPTYLLLNGQPYDPSNPGANAALPQIAGVPSGTLYSSGNMMLRVVNAGLRTHVPSLVGVSLQQIAEDGNRAPGTPQTVSELLMTAGKTRDVLIQPANNGNPTAATPVPATAFTEAAYGFFDRALGLSTNYRPNGGAQGYLAIANAATLASANGGINGWLSSAAGGGKAAASTAAVNPDIYTLAANLTTFTANVLANDVGVTSASNAGTALSAPVTFTTALGGTVTLNPTGTFTYTPATKFITADSFSYTGFGIGGAAIGSTTVTLNVPSLNTSVRALPDVYTSKVATLFRTMTGNGVLANDTDSAGLALTATLDPANAPSGCAVPTFNLDGSFIATSTGVGTCTFGYIASDSQGQTASGSVTVNFPAGSGLAVTVQDALGIQQNAGQTSSTAPIVMPSTSLTDYMWVIEEDPTFHTVPGVTPAAQNGNPALTISNSFHVSHTPIVAAGCTGPLSCGDAQAFAGQVIGATTPRSSPADVALDPT
jgi:hypothetical protein